MRHSRWPGGRLARVLGAALMLAAAITAIGLARALAAPAGCQNWTGTQPLSPGGIGNTLDSVAIESACEAWAVGFQTGSGITATLTERWNGTSWTVVPSPDPGSSSSQLRSVRGTSPSDVWAVGQYLDGTMNKTLILHWDGTTWTQAASPSPGTRGAVLEAVSATSSTDAWAVGSSFSANTGKTLTLHWNGQKWAQVSSPKRSTDDELFAVRGTSSTDTWAVGISVIGGVQQTLALHWNGSTWTRVTTPGPGGSGVSSNLVGVAGTSASDTWAVGSTGPPSANAITSTGTGTLILHWDGSHWARVPSPAPGADSQLFAVAASSAGNIWAVGEYSDGATDHPLAIHCC